MASIASIGLLNSTSLPAKSTTALPSPIPSSRRSSRPRLVCRADREPSPRRRSAANGTIAVGDSRSGDSRRVSAVPRTGLRRTRAREGDKRMPSRGASAPSVASRDDCRRGRAPGGPSAWPQNGLDVALEVPAHHHECIKPRVPQPSADLGRVAAPEMLEPRPGRDVAQEYVLITGGQIHIPFERCAEPALCLIGRDRLVGEEDRERSHGPTARGTRDRSTVSGASTAPRDRRPRGFPTVHRRSELIVGRWLQSDISRQRHILQGTLLSDQRAQRVV